MFKGRPIQFKNFIKATVLAAALAPVVMPAASLAGAPSSRLQAATHRAKASLKSLKTHPGEFKPSAAGPVSPYARAAAEHNAARQLLGNHPPASRVPSTSR